MIKKDIITVEKANLKYIIENKKIKRFKPWLGDMFSFMYDFLMEKSIIPKSISIFLKRNSDIFTAKRSWSLRQAAAVLQHSCPEFF